MIGLATLRRVIFSIPKPGLALTSSTSGPRLERIKSTPATVRPIALAARKHIRRSVSVKRIGVPSPPLWRLERKSSSRLWRFILATTRLPTTKARISTPADSRINSCKRIFVPSSLVRYSAWSTDFAAFFVSASTTPLPCVPRAELDNNGCATKLVEQVVYIG